MKRNRPPLDNEDATLYGEFISSFDAWTGTEGTHKRGRELEQKGKDSSNLSSSASSGSQSGNSQNTSSSQSGSSSESNLSDSSSPNQSSSKSSQS